MTTTAEQEMIEIRDRWTGEVMRKAPRGPNGGADLSGAYLSGAYLSGADLSAADLSAIRDDLHEVLSASPAEAPGLLKALQEGRINGTAYEGECACLVGTIANVRGCAYNAVPDLRPNASRPAERWFLAIMPGNTPDNHPIAAITAEWIEEFIAKHPSSAGAEHG